MKDLLPYFERELLLLRRYAAEFAARFPRVAGRLRSADGDPGVERLMQGVALLSARVAKRIDDGYPQFTEALLESLYPHYLRPFPSCAVASLAPPAGALEEMADVRVVRRGTAFDTQAVQGTRCRFRTAADVSLAPLAIRAASFEPLIQAPSGTPLAADATASLSITIACVSHNVTLDRLALDRLRIHADGDPSFCAALRDALFMHVGGAFVEAEDGRWLPLAAVPLSAPGSADEEALIPFGDRSHRAWRVLLEYFCFPDKFRFFDVDLQAIRPLLPPGAGSVTLHFALSGLRPDGAAARMLRSLRPANLRLFCTSVVNLFPQAVIPVAVTHTASDYSIVADAPRPQAYEVYCVDAVIQQTKDGEPAAAFTPLYAPSHSGGARGRYWVLRHDEMLAEISPGHEKRLALVDINSQALEVERSTLSVNATCTNRDLPHQLPGDAYELAVPGAGNGLAARLLGSPTLPYRFPGGQAHWRLISHLSLNHHALVPRGLPALRELLTLHDLPQSPVTQRLIEGIVDLDHEETTAWMRHKRGSALMYGLEVRITLDEDAFVGSGIHLFAQVMDEFLALYVQANNYVELVLLAQRDKRELLRCKRRSGTANLA